MRAAPTISDVKDEAVHPFTVRLDDGVHQDLLKLNRGPRPHVNVCDATALVFEDLPAVGCRLAKFFMRPGGLRRRQGGDWSCALRPLDLKLHRFARSTGERLDWRKGLGIGGKDSITQLQARLLGRTAPKNPKDEPLCPNLLPEHADVFTDDRKAGRPFLGAV